MIENSHSSSRPTIEKGLNGSQTTAIEAILKASFTGAENRFLGEGGF